MNRLIKEAKVFNLRDKQLEDKKQKEIQKIQEIKKLDAMMELERLKKV